MSIELNHIIIIIPARSKWASATFLASILDVPAGPQRDLFVPVKVSNGVTLDYMDAERFGPHHCAFLASEAEFDAAYARIRSTGVTYYAGPHHWRPSQINHLRGGRSAYFDDPDGHNIEIITRPYDVLGAEVIAGQPSPSRAAQRQVSHNGMTTVRAPPCGARPAVSVPPRRDYYVD